MIGRLIVGYEIDIAIIIKYKIHERAYRVLTSLLFRCLIKYLCDEAGSFEISYIDRRLEMMSIAQTIMIKDPTNPILA